MITVIAHGVPEIRVGPTEMGFVLLASVIIFAILGPRLWRDFRSS
jgi:hypothetical protein